MTAAVSNAQPVNGETVRFDVTVRNDGPGSIRNVFTAAQVEGGVIVTSRCASGRVSAPFREQTSCLDDIIAMGQSVVQSFDVHLSNSASVAVLRGEVQTYTFGRVESAAASSLTARIEVPLRRPVRTADLSLSLAVEPSPAPLSTPLTHVTTLANLGPDELTEVVVIASDMFDHRVPLTGVQGAECSLDGEGRVICRVARIAAGTVHTIRYIRGGANFPTQTGRDAFALASNSYDPVAANNEARITVPVGIPSNLARVLLPIVIFPTEGAFGSRFVSETSVYVDAPLDVFFFPLNAIPCPFLCPPLAFYGEFAPRQKRWEPRLGVNPQNPGYLLRFDAAQLEKVAISHRIRDTSRALDTWGTAIPVITDAELLRGRVQLIDVAAGSRFRQTLRIYEPDALRGQVRVKIFGEAQTETLVGERIVTLEPADIGPTDNLGLPIHPGYAQLDLASLFPAAVSFQRLRIELEPLTSETRYWAFVSITNNDTQHITLVTPEPGR